MSARTCASDAGARAMSSASAAPSGARARGARASARLPRRLVSRDASRATVAVSVSTGGSSTVLVETDAADDDDVVETRDESRDEPRVYVDADRVAGPRLADADFGEHAAAFLSGNFQPLSEELTAVVETGGLDEDEDEDDALERLAPDGSFSEVFEGFVGIDSSLSDSPEEMRVVGRLPAGFPDGKFSYVGPNPKFPREHYKKWGTGPDQPSLGFGEGWHHWFEGDGMVYAVDFTRKEKENDGDDSLSSPSRLVTYRNRYVRTNSWHDELEASTRLFAPLMNASGESFLPNAVHNLFRGGSFLKDSANTALANYGGKMLALQDTMPPWELDADSLETKGACDFDGQLPFYVPFTAHPKVAPDTGHLHFFGFNPVYPPHISLGALDGDTGKMSDVTSLWHNAAQGATFMHDFCVTAKRIVLFEGSMNIRPTRMLGGKHPLMYDPKQRARFGLADRDPSTGAVVGDVRWCECSCAQMVYHFINAYECEETGNVVVTGVREDGFFHGALAANGTRQWIEEALASGDAVPRVHEWVIDPVSCKVIGERWLFDDVVEVPRINDAFAGVKNRFAYAGRVHGSSLANDAQLKFDAVVKFDLETGRSETYEHGVGRYGMEQQFVPATNGKDEDDGWLVLYVHDEAACAVACDETRCETTASTSTSAETSQGQEKKPNTLGLERAPRSLCDAAATGRTECVVLDAKNVAAGPVCRIALPSRVPYGAHALWTPSVDEKKTTAVGPALAAASKQESSAARAARRAKASPPAPRAFAVADGALGALAGAAATGVLRGASGLFVNGWRPWLGADKKDEYAFVRLLGARFTESRKLGSKREAQAREELAGGFVYGDAVAAAARDDFLAAAKLAEAEVSRETPEETRGVVPATPEGVSRRTETENENEKPSERASLPPLRLFEREGCGGSKRVREALCMLDLACEMRPCPLGATRHRKLLLSETHSAPRDSSDQDQTLPSLPFLTDQSTGVSLSGADAIVEYLYATYLDGEAPSPLVAPGFFASARARAATAARGGSDPRGRDADVTGSLKRGTAGAFYARPSVPVAKPLQLWAYEASPFCALVRETLSALEIPYVSQPCARGSTRRTTLQRRAGTFQVPYLEDPNTGVAMFESAEIIEYLRASYQATPPPSTREE